jgi:hypothetical protein
VRIAPHRVALLRPQKGVESGAISKYPRVDTPNAPDPLRYPERQSGHEALQACRRRRPLPPHPNQRQQALALEVPAPRRRAFSLHRPLPHRLARGSPNQTRRGASCPKAPTRRFAGSSTGTKFVNALRRNVCIRIWKLPFRKGDASMEINTWAVFVRLRHPKTFASLAVQRMSAAPLKRELR